MAACDPWTHVGVGAHDNRASCSPQHAGIRAFGLRPEPPIDDNILAASSWRLPSRTQVLNAQSIPAPGPVATCVHACMPSAHQARTYAQPSMRQHGARACAGRRMGLARAAAMVAAHTQCGRCPLGAPCARSPDTRMGPCTAWGPGPAPELAACVCAPFDLPTCSEQPSWNKLMPKEPMDGSQHASS
jgi:hypothetical protein